MIDETSEQPVLRPEGRVRRMWKRVINLWSGESGTKVKSILPGDRIEQKEVVVSAPVEDDQDLRDPLVDVMKEQRAEALSEVAQIPSADQFPSLIEAVKELHLLMHFAINNKGKVRLMREDLALVEDGLTREADQSEALAILEERVKGLVEERGTALVRRRPEVYKEVVKIEALLREIKTGRVQQLTVVEDEPLEVEEPISRSQNEEGERLVEKARSVEQRSMGKRFDYVDGSWREVFGGQYERDEGRAWQAGFMEVERLPNCLSRERDSLHVNLNEEQLGWLKGDVDVSLDKFRLQHVRGKKEEDIYLGMYIAPDLEELFGRAWEMEKRKTEEKVDPGTLEMLLYRGVLEVISKGRGKLNPRPNIDEHFEMYNESNGAGGARRVYFVDLGRLDDTRTFVFVGACRKIDQDDLFKYIER